MTYADLCRKFKALSLRERNMIVAAGLVLILFGGYVGVLEPQLLAKDNVTNELRRKQAEMVRLDNQLQQLRDQLADDPNKPLQQRMQGMQSQLALLDERLDSQTYDLIPPQQMSQVLEQLLDSSGNLRLLELRSLDPQAVVQDEEQVEAKANLYRHGVRLVVAGSYFAISDYLQRLEQLEWQFYWQRLDYQVQEYPGAEVEIELYTLSTSKAFLGL